MPLCGNIPDETETSLAGKTVLVTGANTGIGYYTALDLAKREARVVLACRNKEKAIAARDKIIDETGNEDIFIGILDLSSFASVRKFVNEFLLTEERLDILINNAGAFGLGNQTTADGLQLMIQTNYFGPFLLTNLLLDLMKKSAPSRIINVSSAAAFFAKIDPTNLNSYPGKKSSAKADWILYCNTKLLNIMFTNELALRLEGTGVTANSSHPGGVKTDLNKNLAGLYKIIMKGVSAAFYVSPEEGARTSIYLAVSDDVEDVSGEYFSNSEQTTMPIQADDGIINRQVWEETEKLVKFDWRATQLQ